MKGLMDIVTALDRNEDVHLARILILLKAFQEPDKPAIKGITKLAKLDFLLRYPSCLQTALKARGVKEEAIPVDDFEALTIEARMVRYRFGPWDHRYRKFLNILAARGLVAIEIDGQTINIDLTDAGLRTADALIEQPAFARVFARAKLLQKHLNLRARELMEFIYDTFPELSSLKYNEGIEFRGAAKWI
jgi:hypothetical protein